MADYQRILSYLYRYEKSEKKECLGFIKAEQKSAILKLTIQINDERLLHGMELKLCFYEKQGEHWGVRKLDSIKRNSQVLCCIIRKNTIMEVSGLVRKSL